MPSLREFEPHRKRRVLAGFSLVEVSIAAAFLIVTSVGIFATLTRMQRTAITNRAMTNADNILRSVVDQALSRGWNNEADPLDVLKPTIAGNTTAYNSSTDVSDGTWVCWHFYECRNAVAGETPVVPVYEDVSDSLKNVNAVLYRKAQYVTGTYKMLWVSFRLEYTIRGQKFAQDAWVTRASD